MRDTKTENTISKFEEEVLCGRDPDIKEYLSGSDESDYLFGELLHADLELRLKNGQPIRC